MVESGRQVLSVMKELRVSERQAPTGLIYDNRFWRPILKGVSWAFLKLWGWKVVGDVPTKKRFVIIGAPHTSNWDFPIFLSMVGYRGLRVNYLAKHTLFQGAFGWFFYYLGGIPVDRASPDAKDVVSQVVEEFKVREQIWLGIAPEGTRKKVEKWKTGFYRIAKAADMPVATAYLDKKSKTVGFGPMFTVTGDMEKDINDMMNFYADKTGVNPENF